MARHYGKARARRQKLRKRIRFYLTVTATFTILLGLTFIVIKTSFFRMNIFNYTPRRYKQDILIYITPKVIDSKVSSILGFDHYLAWKNKAYQNAQFSSITVEKDLFAKTVNVKAVPREKAFIWCLEEEVTETCYWLDKQGILSTYAPMAYGQMVRSVISQKGDRAMLLGNKVLEEKTFQVVKEILDFINDEHVSVKEIRLMEDKEELHIETNSNSKIFFSLRFDPKAVAIPAAREILQKIKLSSINYLDLTVENRAFYKLK